jgi:hypothetical protein
MLAEIIERAAKLKAARKPEKPRPARAAAKRRSPAKETAPVKGRAGAARAQKKTR